MSPGTVTTFRPDNFKTQASLHGDDSGKIICCSTMNLASSKNMLGDCPW